MILHTEPQLSEIESFAWLSRPIPDGVAVDQPSQMSNRLDGYATTYQIIIENLNMI